MMFESEKAENRENNQFETTERIYESPAMSRREFLKGSAGAIAAAFLFNKTSEAAALLENVVNIGKEKEGPKIKFEIFYSPHFLAADKKGLSGKITKADIFIPECLAWSESSKNIYNSVSKGEMTPSQLAEKFGLREDPEYGSEASFLWVMRALYNSKKRVEFVDLMSGDPLVAEIRDSIYNLPEVEASEDFSKNVEIYKNKLQKLAQLQVSRQRRITENIFSFKKDIDNGKKPELKGKKEIKILLAYGAQHTVLFHSLSKKKEDVERSFSQMPYIFAHDSEAMRRFMFNKDVSDDLAARALMERLTTSFLFTALPGFESQPKIVFIRRAFQSLSFDDLKQAFEAMKKNLFEPFQSSQIIRKVMEEKGVKFPFSKDELDEIAAKTVKP